MYLAPVRRRDVGLEFWRSYAREQIPPLFGLNFNRAIWNAGFVVQSGHMFLLVTLKKSGTGENFLYEDRFLAPDLFQWQSQNRTTQESGQGHNIRDHAERGIAVHLFVRSSRKTPDGRSAPLVALRGCGVQWLGGLVPDYGEVAFERSVANSPP